MSLDVHFWMSMSIAAALSIAKRKNWWPKKESSVNLNITPITNWSSFMLISPVVADVFYCTYYTIHLFNLNPWNNLGDPQTSFQSCADIRGFECDTFVFVIQWCVFWAVCWRLFHLVCFTDLINGKAGFKTKKWGIR